MRVLVVAATYKAFESWYEKNKTDKPSAYIWVINAKFLRGVSTQDTKMVYTSCAKNHPEYAAIKAAAELIGL